jgi:hypothetical protein
MSWSQAQTQPEESSMQLKGTAKYSMIRFISRRATHLLAAAIYAVLAVSAQAQVKITLADFFTKTNLYYRSYANKYDPSDTSGSTAYQVPTGLIGDAAPNQFWDFSKGPTNFVLRTDYLAPADVPEAKDFPQATLVEQLKVEADAAKPQMLFVRNTSGVGRTVYGFYLDTSDSSLFGLLPFSLSPVGIFNPEIVDFPDPITFGLEWSNSFTYQQDLVAEGDPSAEDPGGINGAIKSDQTSNFKADAYGTIILPDELGGGFGQGLRVNEEVTIDISADLTGEGQFDHIETDYARNYYWFMPGYGLVAQLSSKQTTSPTPTNFTSAIVFQRMFETNKKITTGGGGCDQPSAVTDIRIRVSNGVILLTWGKADCANQYVVQYTTTPGDPASWQALGAPTGNLVWQGETTQKGPARFYRVQSMK